MVARTGAACWARHAGAQASSTTDRDSLDSFDSLDRKASLLPPFLGVAAGLLLVGTAQVKFTAAETFLLGAGLGILTLSGTFAILSLRTRSVAMGPNSNEFAASITRPLDEVQRALANALAGTVIDRLAVNKRKADWFTTHGDVFAVGTSTMSPFPPTSPDGRRSFPSKRLSKGVGQWNHYYVRCINGEVRLWVNGEEVSGGTGCTPRQGYLCLESEGSPVEFRGLRIRELP